MTNIKELVEKLRQKPYYVKLLNILVINGLLDIIEDELEDGKVDYLPLAVNLISFLNQNKKYYRNFSADTFEKILILSIDEILTVKFKIDIDEKHITLALDLLRSSYLFKTLISVVKDLFIKVYYNIKCKKCYSVNDANDVVIVTSNSKSSEQDNI
jgi:hypothetical protein